MNLICKPKQKLGQGVGRPGMLENVYLSLDLMDKELEISLGPDICEEDVREAVGKQYPKRPTTSPREKLSTTVAPRHEGQHFLVISSTIRDD
jgi:hypothetical protein